MLHRLLLEAKHFTLYKPLTSSPLKSNPAAMCTFTLPNSKPEVPVHLTSDLSQERLLSFPAFKTWISTLQHSLSTQQHKSHTFHSAPYKLRKIEIQSVDFFGRERIGFIKLKAEVSNDKGEKLPGSVFVRMSASLLSSSERSLESCDMSWSLGSDRPRNLLKCSNHPSNGKQGLRSRELATRW